MAETDDFIGPVNLGNPVELSILEIANKILLITESQSRIVFKPLPPDDPDRRRPDISIAKKVLNWAPRVSLDEGLGKTIEYFKEKLGIRR
jgi:UDP-glucuronate decarboxylase